MFDIHEELKKLPQKSGCYIMKDALDEIIYIGKAKVLKNRVRQYFQNNKNHSPKIQQMVPLIKSFEYIVTDSELEALILECNLIKKHKPKYNALLKDDKQYPYIKITVNEKYPKVYSARSQKKDKSKYFGPYIGLRAVSETLDAISKIWKIRKCNKVFPRDIGKGRPCLNYHLGQCLAPCTGNVSEEDYNKNITQITEFLQGKHKDLLENMRVQMYECSENLNFEKAAALRDKIQSIEEIQKKQKMVSTDMEDQDIIAFARAHGEALIQIFFIRNGRVIGNEHFMFTNIEDMSRGEVISEFMKQFYSGTPFIPREIILQDEPEDKEILIQWLQEQRGAKVYITVPQKGEKEQLVELVAKNARITFEQFGEKIKRETSRTKGAADEIRQALNISSPITRIEAYDISNIQGFESVGSMVVFEDGTPKRSDYRKFKIKTVVGANDFASMEEVITRRLAHGKKELLESVVDGKFNRLPDLIMMDGGKIQISAAKKAMGVVGIDIPVCGMVKDDRHRTRALLFNDKEITFPINSEGFKLVTRIQDEVHRFALEYHRTLRSKSQVHSILDDIDGIGPARRKALMKKFSSIENIRKASFEELSGVEGMSAKAAQAVYSFFNT